MIRLVRWTISVAIVQSIALVLLARMLPGFTVQPGPNIAIVALLFTVVQLASWPIMYNLSARIHPALFPFLSLFLSGLLLVFLSDVVTDSFLDLFHVANIHTGVAITLGLTVSSTLATGLFSLHDLDAYDWFVTRRLRSTFRSETNDQTPGILFLEIDGLAAPLLQRAMDERWMPHLARWHEELGYQLDEWETDLSSQTSASQAGILLGSNDDIPAFRWYDKPQKKLMVSSSMRTAKELEQRLSTGHGLTLHGGSRFNVFSGDADDSLLTFSTIGTRDRAPSRAYLAMFASPYQISRTLAMFVGDVFRERWQAMAQRMRKVEPRIRRGMKYALTRSATTTIMLEYAQFMLLADMNRGISPVYCTVFAYDEVAHHSGIDRADAFKILTRIDSLLGKLKSEADQTSRPYHLVVLSDHGQSMGATFRQRNRQSLGDLVKSLVGPEAQTVVHDALVEGESNIRMTLQQIMSELDDSRTQELLHRTLRNLSGADGEVDEEAAIPKSAGSDVVVLASGNLGLISFPQIPQRMTYEAIVDQFPLLIPGLLGTDDIGFLMMQSESDGAIVMGKGGIRYLQDDHISGQDPLETYGRRAASHLRRTDGFTNAPDILVMSTYDTASGEVYAFEELVGSHGGLGGTQTRPFVYHPRDLEFPEEPVVGAGALHRVLKNWAFPE